MATTTTTTDRTRFKVLGIDRDRTDCDCCGKSNLKLTVMLGRLDADGTVGEVLWFGRDCAARATRLRRTGAAMETLASEAQRKADEEKRNAVVVVGTTCDAIWIVESIGNNGGSVTKLRTARGLRSEVRAWAEKEYPHCEINVRKAW